MNGNKSVDWASKFNMQALGDASNLGPSQIGVAAGTNTSGLMDRFKFGNVPRSEGGSALGTGNQGLLNMSGGRQNSSSQEFKVPAPVANKVKEACLSA